MQQGPLPKTSFLHRFSLLLLLLACSCSTTFAQIFYTIADGAITTCAGPLLDSGGQGAGGYDNNEIHTLTICPDAADVGISLNFITFNLSTEGTEPWDHLQVYDGNSTSDPLLGDFNGTNPPGIVSASWFNTTGCLTLVFTSNETGTGVFAASITCYEPCQPPTAAGSMSESAPALICQNEIVSFNGSASYGAANYTIDRWIWTFDDGTADSTNGPLVSHAFNIPGEYVVQLQVEDENGCVNTNPMELQILVSTTPQLEGFANQTLCVGESAQLTPSVVEGTIWTGMPEANFGDGVYLPDELGIPFVSSVTFNAFAPGQTLTNINDLLSLCVTMEHSFMGDFVLQITSPNGQSVLLHQQGGGATFLGIPVDDDNQPTVPGTCWQYCFTPDATNGTWVDNGNGGTLPAGDYESLQPLTGLLGSPLNGVWTLTFTDLWGSDNGFMCAWSLTLDPALIPDATVYTPVLGTASPDSTYWSGPFLTPDPAVHQNATATPTAPGTYQYT
ncbi:MAG TPA: PKD domain-containing protein, partial [Flavobacteriales bacterium]